MNQNLSDPASVEYVVSKIPDCLLWVYRPIKCSRSISVINPVKTDAKEAIAATIKFARANIKCARTRRRYCQGTNRLGLRVVEDRGPGGAAVKRAPDSALRRAEINLL